MISTVSLQEKWIQLRAKDHKTDEILIEKMVRALYLLELVQRSSMEFIFKGGTALILLLPAPKRFSIDIDIIVPEKPADIESIFEQIIEKSDFLEYEKDRRTVHSSIDKAHYKFYYKPVSSALRKREYILLDILYEASPYGSNVIDVPLDSTFLKMEGKPMTVNVPNHEAILGDKLTAFAPNTTGIPYGKGKEIEIIKQLYDIGNLILLIKDLNVVNEVFTKVAQIELKYRGLEQLNVEEVLEDIYQTALLISLRGQEGEGSYKELHTGIKNIRHYIFSERFHLEKSIIPASKAAYLSASLGSGLKYINKFLDPKEVEDWIIVQPGNTKLNKLKKNNPEAFFYWFLTEKIKR